MPETLDAGSGLETGRDNATFDPGNLEVTAGSNERETAGDPNIVGWSGPDDPPENPLNWSFAKKTAAIATVSWITFLS